MAATYWVLISDELIAAMPDWGSVGLDPIAPDNSQPPQNSAPHTARWWRVWDEFADASLEGQRVELILATRNGQPVITDRRPA